MLRFRRTEQPHTAYSTSAMETRDHSNGVSPKNQRSRGNFLTRMLVVLWVLLAGSVLNAQTTQYNVLYVNNSGLQTTSGSTPVTVHSATSTFTNTTLTGGWYMLTGTRSNVDMITISGTVNLILADGCNWTFGNGGVRVNSGNTLNIYAQSSSTGRLTAIGSSRSAGIGGASGSACGTVTIYGGRVTATGSDATTGGSGTAGEGAGAGIGGGRGSAGGSINIYGGIVMATGGEAGRGGNGTVGSSGRPGGGGAGAGIGGGGGNGGGASSGIGGSGGAGGTVNIYGGAVTATGGEPGDGGTGMGVAGGSGGGGGGGGAGIGGGGGGGGGGAGAGTNNGGWAGYYASSSGPSKGGDGGDGGRTDGTGGIGGATGSLSVSGTSGTNYTRTTSSGYYKITYLYTVTFNANGGSPTPSSITSVQAGTTISAPTSPTRSGYQFNNWWRSTTLEGTQWTFSSSLVMMNTTLYARWLYVPDPYLSRSFSTCEKHVILTWDNYNPDNMPGRFWVYRRAGSSGSWTRLNSTGILLTVNTYIDTDIAYSTYYEYAVIYQESTSTPSNPLASLPSNTDGSPTSFAVKVRTTSITTTPNIGTWSASAEGISQNTINVTFNVDPCVRDKDPAAKYRVERSINGGAYSPVATNLSLVSGTIQTYLDVIVNPDPCILYKYRVVIDAFGTSFSRETNETGVMPYIITPTGGANGTISPNTPIPALCGENQTFTAAPNNCHEVNQWIVNGVIVQTGGTTYTVSNVQTNTTIQVTFKTITYTVTPMAGSGGSISPNTVQTVNCEGSQLFMAMPNPPCQEVDQWFVDGILVQTGGTTYTVSNVQANTTVSVTFKTTTYSVTPSAGNGGSISPSNVQTVNCGNSQLFMAIPNTCQEVDQWFVNGSIVQIGGTTYTVSNVQANTTVDVTFKTTTYSVTPSAGNGGSISPNVPTTVLCGENQTFTFTPAACYQIAQVTVNGTPVTVTDNSYTVENVTANATIHVTFEIITYTITVSANPPAGGTATGGGTFDCGDSKTVTATANSGYKFVNWTKDGSAVSTANPYTFTVTENIELVANFAKEDAKVYQVTVSVNNEAYGTANGGGTYEENTTATVTATANSGYKFVNWTKNGVEVSPNNQYSFTVTEDVELVANFEEDGDMSIVETGNYPSIRVYPNPTDGQLIIDCGRDAINRVSTVTVVEIYDVMGRKALTSPVSFPSSETTLNLAHLPTGVYFLKIQTDDGVVVRKVVKN